jgi:hypothetical protein
VVRESGFDSLEIRMGHGRLISPFLSPGSTIGPTATAAAWSMGPARPVDLDPAPDVDAATSPRR